MKNKSKIDIAVLILFFARSEQLAQVFAEVKKARPSRLYLYQDGAREGREDDVIGIQKCRDIVDDSQIDWECEVHRLYQDKNYGCDPSEYMAQKWMFETEEMGIVLEDDDVPSQSFFPFCKELLVRYKDDDRINMICGMNNLQEASWVPYDYLFSTSGAITGWASWKRVINQWEEKVKNLDNSYFIQTFSNRYESVLTPKIAIQNYKNNNDSGKAHYEAILSAHALSNSMLNIVPTKNLISNIGIAEGATHSVSSLKMLPRGIRKIFFMPTFELSFPLKHPPYMIEDIKFKRELDKRMGNGFFRSKFRKIESIILRIRYGDFNGLWKSLLKK